MPVTVTVKRGQTILDIAIEYLGDAERIDELCSLNEIGITDDLAINQILLIPDIIQDKKNVVAVFSRRKIKPASALETLVLDQSDWDVFYGLYD